MGSAPTPSPDAEISIGSVIDGRYRIDAVLGAGGMGRVYRGEHTGIGRAVAIKVLHADLGRNREASQRFQREALASGRLDHPNIVGVSDFGVIDDGPCYLVMEALEGESLGARLERDTRLPWQEALDIMRGVLLGLRHAHERGVVHRDIKPDNVFLARKDGESIVKILDFGIAKLYAGSPDDPASTRAGLTVGTPAYLSPEQAVGGEIKPPSDLYSATILLFEMLTGRPPFQEADPLAMLGAHVSREPPRLVEVAPDLIVPPALEAVIQHGLQKTQAERIGTAQDYLAALDHVLASARGSAPHPLGVPIVDEGGGLGSAPTAELAPMSMATPPPRSAATPPPGTLSPFTPVPGALPVAAQTAMLPRLTTAADGAPIPRRWLMIGGIVLAAMVVVGVILALSTSGGGPAPAPAPARPGASTRAAASAPDKTVAKPTPAPPAPAPTPPPIVPPLEPAPAPVDAEARYKALIQALQAGKTCADRKAPIAELVALGDKRAIAALKRARYRMRGGVLGLGDSNSNACLKAEADAAIKTLGKQP